WRSVVPLRGRGPVGPPAGRCPPRARKPFRFPERCGQSWVSSLARSVGSVERKQAAEWLSPCVRVRRVSRVGRVVAQASITRGQRGAKEHPGGNSDRLGGPPGRDSGTVRSPVTGGTEPMSAEV